MSKVDDYARLIRKFAQAPDSQLATVGSKMCAEWDGEDPVRFLRDLLDLCVRYAWGSRFTIQFFEVALDAEPPETPEEAKIRRNDLRAKWEPA